jgi:hypothetical protein
MYQKVAWSAIIVVVLLLLALMQFVRVNQPKPSGEEKTQPLYTSKGPLVNGPVTIQPRDFFSKHLNLNRRLRLTGTFRTANLRSRVSTLVISAQHLQPWKLGSDHPFLARTGYVPGGKVNLVLEAGTYVLLIDNREGDENQSVDVDFHLE